MLTATSVNAWNASRSMVSRHMEANTSWPSPTSTPAVPLTNAYKRVGACVVPNDRWKDSSCQFQAGYSQACTSEPHTHKRTDNRTGRCTSTRNATIASPRVVLGSTRRKGCTGDAYATPTDDTPWALGGATLPDRAGRRSDTVSLQVGAAHSAGRGVDSWKSPTAGRGGKRKSIEHKPRPYVLS